MYLHIPFCKRRCGYCDFNTFAGRDELIPAYVEALETEVMFYAGRIRKGKNATLKTIYFGGGTPSLLAESQFEMLLGAIRENFRILDDCEITIEANPGTVDSAYLEAIHQLGVNRLSLGVQSAAGAELAVLDRQHGFPEAEIAVQDARKAGFENISLDLIYGIPGQTMETWKRSLDAVISLSPEHLSLYSLTVEPGTPLEAKIKAGLLAAPDDDLAADMYDLARRDLDQEGFTHYEISNWGQVREGRVLVSRHNQQYWRNLPYLGLGASAHGYFGGIRYENVSEIAAYIRCIKQETDLDTSPATVHEEKIDRTREMSETMMMGLRLIREGVTAESFMERFGKRLDVVFGTEIGRLVELGLLEWTKGDRVVRLTKKGYLLGNQVFRVFV